MITEDQSAVIGFLASPSTHGGVPVERIDTHISVVFLVGEHAYKLKRAVRFDYLDAATAAQRHLLCDAELRLNQPAAPAIYDRVVTVTRELDGSLALDGSGTPIEWVVRMKRFSQDGLFDRLASRNGLDLRLMPPLAEAIAAFHAAARKRTDKGGRAGMAWVIDGNDSGFAEYGHPWLDPSLRAQVTRDSRRALEDGAALLEQRRLSGSVRECHGDLHLRNIVLINGQPTLFDGVEFNDDISCIDLLYDLAFLLMDLWRRHLPDHANLIWNRYMARTEDSGARLLPLFLACRAAVRAKTTATAAAVQTESAQREAMQALAAEYLSLAAQFLHPAPPALIAIGGFSGTGKSSVARRLASDIGAAPGALVLRSDEIRKRLCGVATLTRLGSESYSAELSARVYQTLAERAAQTLGAGHSVIVDAVYARPADRAAIAAVAASHAIPFAGLWLEAPEAVLTARVEGRREDPSDANPQVIRMQRAEGTGHLTWHLVDASRPLDAVVHSANEILRGYLPGTGKRG